MKSTIGAGITTAEVAAIGHRVDNPTRGLRRRLPRAVLCGLLALSTLSAKETHGDRGPLQDPASIQRAALAFAATLPKDMPGERRFEVTQLDPRLRLARCDAPLSASATDVQQGSRHTTIRVDCPVAPGWSLYVPVQARYRSAVVVAAAGLARGHVVTQADLRVEARELARSDLGLLRDPAEAVGMQLRRPVAAGTPLRARALEAVDVIHRGDRVVIDAVRASFRVRMQGESLQDAAPGERVRVRNLSSRRIVEGVAEADGTVRVMR